MNKKLLAAFEKEHALVDELCTAMDNAADDIGGSRPIGKIMAELGPAWDAAESLRKKVTK